MKRRHFLTTVGATGVGLALPFSLAACGSPASDGKVTINWWHIQTQDPGKSNWQTLANQYSAAHPNVKINITILENDAFKTKLTTVLQSGQPPDIFQSWGGGVLYQYAKAGLVKDISSSLQGTWGDSFYKPALDVYGKDGRFYGVPWDMGAVGIWYNKALFTKAGINQTPTTWNEFLQTVKTLKSAGITPIGLGEKDKWPGHFWWVYLAMRLGGKASFDKAYNRTGSFADEPFVKAGEYLKQLIALEPFQQGYLGAAYADEQTIMGNGKAAMELMGQWAPNSNAASAEDKKGPDFGFFPFPMVEGGAGNATDVMGGGNGFTIGKNAPAETIDFVKFLTNAENQRTLGKTGMLLPVVKGTEDAVINPQLQDVQKAVINAGYFQLYYDQYLPPAVSQVILDATQGLFAGTTTPEAAAKAIDTSVASSLT